ncbi:hypothetical protein BDR05DRAFT_1006916 [Suillus weaverae]|nr:hypothetical protein BDR05DRAFT_1006916 [Suillus weaverae]
MSEMFTLYCWIRGTDIHEHFELKISPTETVNTLKTMIKDYHALEIPASALRLYKPSLPLAEPFEASLGNVRLSELGEPLLSLQDMSHLFNEPPPKCHIHLIVDPPQLSIYCWLRGRTGKEGFDISISSKASIGALKDRIKEDESRLKNVDNSRISLFRISGSDDDLQETLDTNNAGHLLDVTKALPIYTHFLCVPVLEQLRIVVQVYSENNSEVDESSSLCAPHLRRTECNPNGTGILPYPYR